MWGKVLSQDSRQGDDVISNSNQTGVWHGQDAAQLLVTQRGDVQLSGQARPKPINLTHCMSRPVALVRHVFHLSQ